FNEDHGYPVFSILKKNHGKRHSMRGVRSLPACISALSAVALLMALGTAPAGAQSTAATSTPAAAPKAEKKKDAGVPQTASVSGEKKLPTTRVTAGGGG